jgi:hypothetical protein
MKWSLSLEDAVAEYGLEDHIAELDEVGMTIVPPEKTGIPKDAQERARDVLLSTVRERTGAIFDVDRGPLSALDESRAKSKGYFFVSRMIEVDPVFLDLQTNPVLNTLHRFILGEEFRMGTSSGFLKWAHPQGGQGAIHGMHVDSPLVKPAGYGYVANVNWLLTDYTREAGPICYVPGSHKWGDYPTAQNVTPQVLSQVKPAEGPANSLVVFNGSLWHGTLPRTLPGMRLSSHSQRRIPALLPPGDFRDVSDALIASSRDPEAMRMLCWKNDMRGLAKGGPEYDRARGIPRAMEPAE